MKSRRLTPIEKAFSTDREEYVIEMLFQLSRIAARDRDLDLSEAIHAVWKRFRQRATDRVLRPNADVG